MDIRLRGVAVGRLRHILGRSATAVWPLPGMVRPPLGGIGLQDSETIKIDEPSPVRAHLSYSIKLSRCSYPAFPKSGARHSSVRQGNLRNCPLPAILAAMVHCGVFGNKIDVVERKRKAFSVQLDEKGVKEDIEVDRYFEISFPGADAPVKVTDYLWGKGACEPHYATSTDKALWVSLIEKAFVKNNAGNSYQRVEDAAQGPDANTVFEALTGFEAWPTKVKDKSDTDLKKLIRKARKQPMITDLPGANANDPNTTHAYVVLGMDAKAENNVNLFDARVGDAFNLDLPDYKKLFRFIVHRSQAEAGA